VVKYRLAPFADENTDTTIKYCAIA
jgi:hypothetical protein